MLNMQNASCHDTADPLMVESLANAAISAMERASIKDITTPSDVISASFTILDRTLRSMRTLQAPDNRAFNAKEIARVLQDFLVDYGSLPN